MKTPMQELIEKLDKTIESGMNTPSTWSYMDAIQSVRDIAERMLEKEKEVMCQFQSDGQRTDFFVKYEDNDDCFEQTFNTKEK
jgi:hypothetical protein